MRVSRREPPPAVCTRRDCTSLICPISHLVAPAAHRATKAHAFAQAIKLLDTHGGRYRVLALSATPGSDLGQVNEVIGKLHISRIEVRTHDDESVAKYKKETTVRLARSGDPHATATMTCAGDTSGAPKASRTALVAFGALRPCLQIDKVTVPLSPEIDALKQAFIGVLNMCLEPLMRSGAVQKQAASRLSGVTLLKHKMVRRACTNSHQRYRHRPLKLASP